MQYNDLIELLTLNNIDYRTEPLYDGDNEEYPCIWLKKGHLEFDQQGYLYNVVTY